MKFGSCVPVVACVLAAHAAVAQNYGNHGEEPVVTIIVNENEADAADVQHELLQNAPTNPKDNGLPRFAIVGKDRLFYLGIGAQMQGEAVFDFGDEMPSALDFMPAALTAPAPGDGSSLRFALQSSSIYLNFVAMPGTENKVSLFFKGKFNDTWGFKMSHLYAKYRGLTVGHTNSIFSDGAAMPYTIDSEGPNGSASVSMFTAYWEQDFAHGLSGGIGIDAPTGDMSAGMRNRQVSQRIPAVPVYVQYAWAGGDSHVRVSGLVRPMQYRNLVAEKNHTPVGLGVQLSGMAQVGGPLTVYYDATYGRGIGTYIQDDNGLALDATSCTDDSGDMKLTRTLGVTGGLGLALSKKVSATMCYSHVSNYLADGARLTGDEYRYGDYVAANVVYTFSKFVAMGVEYDYGHRRGFDDSSLHGSRVQCQLAVTF